MGAGVVAQLGHAGDEYAVLGHCGTDRGQKRLLGFDPDDRIRPLGTDCRHLGAPVGAGGGTGRQRGVQVVKGQPGVGVDAQGVGVIAAQFLRVNVNLDDALAVEPLGVGHAGAHGQYHVVVVLGLGYGIVPQPKRAQGQGMAVGDCTPALGGHYHRGLQVLGHLDQRLLTRRKK